VAEEETNHSSQK